MLTRRHPLRIHALQADLAWFAASPPALFQPVLSIAPVLLQRLVPRRPISLRVAHHAQEYVAVVCIADKQTVGALTDFSRLTWLPIERRRNLGPCQNVPQCQDGTAMTPIGRSSSAPLSYPDFRVRVRVRTRHLHLPRAISACMSMIALLRTLAVGPCKFNTQSSSSFPIIVSSTHHLDI
jgi:hypothetical protein